MPAPAHQAACGVYTPRWTCHQTHGSRPGCLSGRHASGRSRRDRASRLPVSAAADGGSGLLAKLGRVIKEKAQADIDRIFKGTSKTREKLAVVDELLAYWKLEDADDVLEELEEALIVSDFGPRTSLKIVDLIRERVRNGELKSGADIRAGLKQAIELLLQARVGSSELSFSSQPGVILVVGVNGGGKTTTIGKLAHKFTREGARVLVVPGDTFRAAAGEQLAVWAQRAGAAFHEPPEGARPSTVLYTAMDDVLTGRTQCDIILGDTSGRLHTNANLMEELVKVKKTVTKRYPGAPHETLLVLDGTTGLNMLPQAREFNAAVGLTGLILTKLDGSARGGAVVSVVDELGLPVKFIGVGETIDDLQPFDAKAFVDALFEQGLTPKKSCRLYFERYCTRLCTVMSYNGIGLASVRGSGTSGYVQTNKFHLKASRLGPRDHGDRDALQGGMRKPNKEILEHNRRRALELKLLELREKLEAEGKTPEQVEDALAEQRAALSAQAEREEMALTAPTETHAMAARKEAEMVGLRAAFGIKGEAVEGEAFDRELQERRKQERMVARQEAELARERARDAAEKEARRQQKERDHEAERRQKQERAERDKAPAARRPLPPRKRSRSPERRRDRSPPKRRRERSPERRREDKPVAEHRQRDKSPPAREDRQDRRGGGHRAERERSPSPKRRRSGDGDRDKGDRRVPARSPSPRRRRHDSSSSSSSSSSSGGSSYSGSYSTSSSRSKSRS